MKRKELIAVVLAWPSAIALAQDQACIAIKVTPETVSEAIDKKDRKVKQLLPAETINPGEVVLYTVSATNVCDRPIESAVILTPMPRHVTYIANSAVGPGTTVTFSVDGGFNYGAPDSLSIAGSGGTSRKALPKDYTHIRWVMSKPLKPGAVALARFRALFER
jgi:uncharacterized repeat protein (TIGR01451 family)